VQELAENDCTEDIKGLQNILFKVALSLFFFLQFESRSRGKKNRYDFPKGRWWNLKKVFLLGLLKSHLIFPCSISIFRSKEM
jgi:hypothetical protein